MGGVLIAMKIALIISGILVSVFLCTITYGIVESYVYRWKAIGLPALLHDPLYWLFLILVVGGEIWLGISKFTRW
jgi:hypothetical protein